MDRCESWCYSSSVTNTEHLGDTIRRLRAKRRVEAVELAERAGVSVYTLSRVENKHGGMQWDTAIKVLTALGHEIRIVRTPAIKLKADFSPLAATQLKAADENDATTTLK